MATVQTPPTPAIQWKTNEPVWVEQWPMTKERQEIAAQLVQQQLEAGHIRPSTSPWNTPIFVIPKKKPGAWRLLHDLRAVNNQMFAMGALQPGLPLPTMLPADWHLLVIDLKDCFFTIPLQPQDTCRFAFTLRSTNHGEPDKRYEWVVLPQGMKNSPTMCQLYVAWALQPLREQYSDMIIYHYMDDILFASPQPYEQDFVSTVATSLAKRRLLIAPEKIQQNSPWNYLRWKITDKTVHPLQPLLLSQPQTLAEAQKLVGELQWLQSIAGLTNSDLAPFVALLRGTNPATPVVYDNETLRHACVSVGDKLSRAFADRRWAHEPLILAVCNLAKDAFALLCQSTHKEKGGERILEWLFPSINPKSSITTPTDTLALLIVKGRKRCVDVSGQEPSGIWIDISTQAMLEWVFAQSTSLKLALEGFPSQLVARKLGDKRMQSLTSLPWQPQQTVQLTPLANALTVYTDAGKKSKRAVCVWRNNNEWKHHYLSGTKEDSLQTLELKAILWALMYWKDTALNVVSDSQYAVGITNRIAEAIIKKGKRELLEKLFTQLAKAIAERSAPCCVMHIRSHLTNLGLGEGNEIADRLVALHHQGPIDHFQAARQSHEMFHQNAKALQRAFKLSHADAQGIVKSCDLCSHHSGPLGIGVNPKGLYSGEL